ncbi:YceI family protein [Polaribacter dokdonensis]|uniref:YceI like family protein n=1 Tax=Polaribacter dokdonensis DSW-5 TaxID=1300348 RepID=A0A0M9CGS6_9FLAO|nr:YceI family protein [Polaribacter dokdonensis]KOY52163.1 YceI like family protein [Polaribacter dokdonensis DSW-5]SED94169.1 YceI-like domain-containing protein [Polaribacter dokdonensis DSW-5]
MKKLVVSLIVVASVLTGCKNEKKEVVETKEAKEVEVNVAELNNVNLSTSMITWKGYKPTGSHNGTVAIQDADLLIEDGALKAGEFTIDMNSIKVEDIPADNDGNAKLRGHLTSADFFDVATYPTSKFVITNVEKKEGNKVHLTGNLTIKDVTKSVTIPAMMSTENGVTTLESETFMIDRAEFNVKYGSKSFFDDLKDKFINDDMEMSFVVKTKA